MLEKLKAAVFGRGQGEVVPARPPMPQSTALVPVIRPSSGVQMGALDQTFDSARPTLMPMPALRSFDEESRRVHMPATAHARHLTAVSGFLQYGVELNAAWMVGGDGLRLNLKPVAHELGWDDEEARRWSAAVENLFAEWSNDVASCDAAGRMKFSQMQAAAVRSYLASGDVMAALDYGVKPSAAWRTSVSMIDPMRVWTPVLPHWGWNNSDGILFDARGRAIAYNVKDLDRSGRTTQFNVYGQGGKRLFHHGYDADVGTIRGVSPLAASVGGILQALGAVDAATLAAHVAAMVIGTLTSDFPSDAALSAFRTASDDPMAALQASRVAWHEGLKASKSDVQLGHGARVVHLATGERLELHGSTKNFEAYEVILMNGLREAARALGLSYEALTSDKSEATYSSLKYASTEARSIMDRRRKAIIEPMCEWALENVIEEAIATGRITYKRSPAYRRMSSLDAFREQKRWLLKAEWTAPSIADPDEYKSARAAVLRMQYGLSSISEERAALGKDSDAVWDSIQRDREEGKRRGLFFPMYEPGRRSTNGGTA